MTIFNIEKIYLESIRSILCIDDEHPTFEIIHKDFYFDEKYNSFLGLQKYFNQQGKIIDVENSLKNESIIKKSNSSDLIILDYVFNNDTLNTIKFIAALTNENYSKKIILYTNEPQKKSIIYRIALSISHSYLKKINDQDDFKNIESFFDIFSEDDVNTFINSIPSEVNIGQFYQDLIKNKSIEIDKNEKLSEIFDSSDLISIKEKLPYIFSKFIYNKYNVCNDVQCQPSSIQFGNLEKFNWIKFNNIFLVIINKSIGAENIVKTLEESINNANFSKTEKLIALIRKKMQETGYNYDKINLPDKDLQDALFYYINHKDDDDNSKKKIRAKIVIENLISTRVSNIVEEISSSEELYSNSKENPVLDVRFALNIFLCTEMIPNQKIKNGTIFKFKENYFLVTTPSCDLVNESDSDFIKVVCIQLLSFYDPDLLKDTHEKVSTDLKSNQDAKSIFHKSIIKENFENGDYIFFLDGDKKICAKVTGNISDKNITKASLKIFYIKNVLKREEDKKLYFRGYFIGGNTLGSDQSNSEEIKFSPNLETFEFISQLKHPYAEQILSRVGHAHSKIGVSYVNINYPPQNSPKGGK